MIATTYICHGWAIQNFKLSDGEQFVILLRENTPRTAISSKTFYTVGRINAAHATEGVTTPDRPAGFLASTDLPETLTKGRTTLTAVGACEWWCSEAKLSENKGKAPVMTAVILSPKQVQVLPVGTKLLFCEGSGSIDGVVFTKAQALEVSTEEKTRVNSGDGMLYALIFEASNPAATPA
jgi:hypothetical protein